MNKKSIVTLLCATFGLFITIQSQAHMKVYPVEKNWKEFKTSQRFPASIKGNLPKVLKEGVDYECKVSVRDFREEEAGIVATCTPKDDGDAVDVYIKFDKNHYYVPTGFRVGDTVRTYFRANGSVGIRETE